MDESIARIAEQLDRDRRAQAESMTFEERATAGVALFDVMTMSMRAGIRMQYPEADEETVEKLLIERLRNAKRFEARQ